eukprot:7142455-Pyramimonas_sp.AAC.1
MGTHALSQAAGPLALLPHGQDLDCGKRQQDPWHDGAAKLAVHDLPAHVCKQLEETMAAQIADASAKFEAAARA